MIIEQLNPNNLIAYEFNARKHDQTQIDRIATSIKRGATKYALDNLEDGGACYAAVPAGPLNFIFLKEWIKLLVIHQQLVWAKDSMVLGHSDYHYKHEPILYGWKPGSAHYFPDDRMKTSLLEIERYRKYCTDNNKSFECKVNGHKYE